MIIINNTAKRVNVLIWDSEASPPVGNWMTILWSDYPKSVNSGIISIPTLVEEKADEFKSRYLSWVFELGESLINGKRLIDHLEIRNNLSYWWMTSMAQKFNVSGKSNINDAIKLFALEELLHNHKVTSVSLVSNNKAIAKTLDIYYKRINIPFSFKYSKKQNKTFNPLKTSYTKLPLFFKALISLTLYLKKLVPFLIKNPPPLNSNYDICLVDVLVHLNKKTFETGDFSSNYWTNLVDYFKETGLKTNWIHLFFKHKEIPSLKDAEKLVNRINNKNNQVHQLVESNVTFSVLKQTLIDFFKLNRAYYNLSNINDLFQVNNSNLNLWHLFRIEWKESLCGGSSVLNCLYLALLEKTFNSLKSQKLGIYIQENQPWEMSLIYAWKNAGHGRLIGVPHTTVRYWDLRYSYDPRSYLHTVKNNLPMPDLVAVNGIIAKKNYLKGNYPLSQIEEVEALRYIHLNKASVLNPLIKSREKTLTILICGDFLNSTNYKLLSWVTNISSHLPEKTSYILKPHPAYPIDITEFSTLNLKITNISLAELFKECDMVFTSNITSAAVDAYCSGIPVIQMLDGKYFNTSPLRGLKGIMYVTNPTELLNAIQNFKSVLKVNPEPYFNVEEELPRWRKLLGI